MRHDRSPSDGVSSPALQAYEAIKSNAEKMGLAAGKATVDAPDLVSSTFSKLARGKAGILSERRGQQASQPAGVSAPSGPRVGAPPGPKQRGGKGGQQGGASRAGRAGCGGREAAARRPRGGREAARRLIASRIAS